MGKGGDFEREVSKALTVWLTGKPKPYKYWRMPGSGGLATIHEENVDLSGDIRALAPDAEFLTDHFSIECKNGYPKTSFWQHFKNIKNFNIREFWIQCIDDAKKGDKSGMLIYRKKGQKYIVGIEVKEANKLRRMNLELFELPAITMTWECDYLPPVEFFSFENFFKIITPKNIKEMMEKL